MKYVSLLRGINVGGHKIIRMTDLKSVYERLGFDQVATYIQSGNVIFESADRSRPRLQTRLEDAIAEEFGFAVPVELRSHRELRKIVANCPFGLVDLATEGTRVLVAFLSAQPAAARVDSIRQFVVPPEELVVKGREAYLSCPLGCRQSKLSTAVLERKLGVSATVRNWKSVHKLIELSG